jgi:hypothetical protein
MWGLSYSANKDAGDRRDCQHSPPRRLPRAMGFGLRSTSRSNSTRTKGPGSVTAAAGRFTVAVQSVAIQFLQEYGGEHPLKTVRFAQRQVFFKPSNRVRPRDGHRRQTSYALLTSIPTRRRRNRKGSPKQKRIRYPSVESNLGGSVGMASFPASGKSPLTQLGSLGYDEDRREFRIDFGSKINRPTVGTDQLGVLWDGRPSPGNLLQPRVSPDF